MTSIFGRFSRNSEKILIEAQKQAQHLRRPVQTDMVILGILHLSSTPASDLLKNIGLTYENLTPLLTPVTPPIYQEGGNEQTPEMQLLLEESIKLAGKFRFNLVEVEHLLYVISKFQRFVGHQLIKRAEVDPEVISSRIREWLFSMAMLSEQQQNLPESPEVRPDKEKMDIDRFIFNVTEAAAKGELDPVIGREKEIDQLIHILLRRRKNNPLMLGEPGVGKTALVDALAHQIVRKTVPKALVNKRIYTLDLGLVVAGTMYRGQFEERLKGILQEVQNMGNCLLFIDEIHTLSGTGSAEGGFDAANILKPALARGEITVIGATTHEEYRKHILKDKALDRRFQTLIIEEPTVKETIAMLKGLKRELENHHHVVITEEAIRTAVELSQRYIHDRFLPDKAIDILDQAATLHAEEYVEDSLVQSLQQEIAYVATQKSEIVEGASCQEDWDLAKALSERETQLLQQLQNVQQEKDKLNSAKTINQTHISLIVSRRTGIPLSDIEQTLEPMNIKWVKEVLTSHILGQEEAMRQISQALMRAQLGLGPEKKPMASFLLVGPTGIGKTETARVLAKEVFGDPKALIKIDMSEYMERHNVSNLIGAPAGYIGFDQGGSLTEQVRRRPYAVVLFDEVEKAHPDVFHLLLQILEDGHLSDNTGNRISFEHTFIILTSNIGMESFNQVAKIGFSVTEDDGKEFQKRQEELHDHIERELSDFFRPEMLGRLTGVIYYQPLSQTVVKRLIQKRISEFKRKVKQKAVILRVTNSLIQWLVTQYDPEAGARSIDRLFLQYVEPAIVQAILDYPKENRLALDIDKEKVIAKPDRLAINVVE